MPTKDALLKLLKDSKESWISGETLAGRLLISRSAVWKQIRTLQDEGYLIESSTKKGYLLRKSSELLLPAEIKDGLNTASFGRERIDYFAETDSTNIRARAIATEGAPEGTVVVAEAQLQGKGRRGRAWHSPAGEGITVSVILRPRVQPYDAPQLILASAVAAAETLLAHADIPVAIKWPNDILVSGKKIAGILTEMSVDMDRIDYVIIGLGLNVNTPASGLPPEIKEIATSLCAETGRVFPRVELLQTYLEKLEGYYALFQERNFGPIRERWLELSKIIGRQVKIAGVERTYEGEVVDIDPNGFLILKSPDGSTQRILAGDVSLIGDCS
jgi:BirA family biotin operon repressor/biotin-[acetyl-CoA-carboxylase] ligase